jgi:hypothetical protein
MPKKKSTNESWSAHLSDDQLIISLPVRRRRSNSGKTILVASTNGAKESGVLIDGQMVHINVNAYTYPD